MNQYILIFCLVASSFAAIVQLSNFYDYIIVGAGWAGLGACKTLSAMGAKVLIIEAKNRKGGRCTTFNYSGVQQDLGSAFLHFPYDGNALHDLATALNVSKIEGRFDVEKAWFVNKTVVAASVLASAETTYNATLDFIKSYSDSQNGDLSVAAVVDTYWKRNTATPFVKSRVNQELQVVAIDSGADLTTMSAWEFEGENDGSDQYDYTINPTLTSLYNSIFQNYCSGNNVKLNLNEKVLRVDYSGTNIVITTDKAKYNTNKLLLSPSIGILQASLANRPPMGASVIQFIPQLPAQKRNAINQIGFGRFQKLFVTFSQAFWQTGDSILHFICNNSNTIPQPCKYVEAWVHPVIPKTLIFFIAGDFSSILSKMNIEQIKTDLLNSLRNYITSNVTITNAFYTNWQNDVNVLGSYTYAKVGTSKSSFQNLKKVLESRVNNVKKSIWFIGQGTNPNKYSYAHGAFESGVDAATAALHA